MSTEFTKRECVLVDTQPTDSLGTQDPYEIFYQN